MDRLKDLIDKLKTWGDGLSAEYFGKTQSMCQDASNLGWMRLRVMRSQLQMPGMKKRSYRSCCGIDKHAATLVSGDCKLLGFFELFERWSQVAIRLQLKRSKAATTNMETSYRILEMVS